MSSATLTTHDCSTETRELWPEIDRLTSASDVQMPSQFGWYPGVKVALDYAIAVALLPLVGVLVGFAALAVKASSSGPVFYTQTRIGIRGKRYKIIKIRTMHHNCEVHSGIRWAQKGDSRVTRVGKFLRATHIDELPQILNVLSGEMSLVGPRPERPEVIQAKGLDRLVPGYKHRLLVKPGVTGLAQVQLAADTDITSVRYKIVYDLYYVQNQSLLLDLRLLVATLFKAAGCGPRLLRLLFLLPSRRKVAAVFNESVAVPGESGALSGLQPA